MRAALGAGFVTATEVADFLAARGVPFREAHEITGKARARSDGARRRARRAAGRGLRGFHPALDEEVLEVLDPEVAIERRTGFGAPSLTRVKAAIATARERLGAPR